MTIHGESHRSIRLFLRTLSSGQPVVTCFLSPLLMHLRSVSDLGPDATILFVSESIADILGYQPNEVQGKPCFDFFHPEEQPHARSVHSRGVLLDKAAVLHYARLLTRDGRWIDCECCFTVVHDVIVACTSIYRRNAKSESKIMIPFSASHLAFSWALVLTDQGRAIEAPQIRRIFSCSPRDPRYHMLEHLSPKFKTPSMEREPRAALILNRFTRSLNVMFATASITAVVGLQPEEIKNKSFYRCIQESCLAEAIECLESAKANDSIAFVRFRFQDPRDDDELSSGVAYNDDGDSDSEDDDEDMTYGEPDGRRHKKARTDASSMSLFPRGGRNGISRVKVEEDDADVSLRAVPRASRRARSALSRAPPSRRLRPIELEAVVSCTSDGLVVVLRKARPPIPAAHPPFLAMTSRDGAYGPPSTRDLTRPRSPNECIDAFRPPCLQQRAQPRGGGKDAGGPPLDVLMGTIRDVAVFAWGVVGMKSAMTAYGRDLSSSGARAANGGSCSAQECRVVDLDDDMAAGYSSETSSTHSGFQLARADNERAPGARSASRYRNGVGISGSPGYESYEPMFSTAEHRRYNKQPMPSRAPERSEYFSNREQYTSSFMEQAEASPLSFTPFQSSDVSRETGCQSMPYASSAAQGPRANATGSIRTRSYGWH